MGEDCIFCGIVAGDLPSYDLYEDDEVLAFLDVNPAAEGHALVVPKEHHERVTDFDAETTAAVFTVARRVAAAMDAALDPDGFNLFQTNGGGRRPGGVPRARPRDPPRRGRPDRLRVPAG